MALRALLIAAAAALLCGCGAAEPQARKNDALPGAGKPPVRLATKNFTEQFILGELYAQALRAKGFTVEMKPNVGSSELVDQALTAGAIDMYPEYIGVIAQELAGPGTRPRSRAETYRRAKAFEEERGFTILRASPGSDTLANAVRPDVARRHDLETTADLARLGRFRYGGPPENRTRFQGAVGLRRVYGLDFDYVGIDIEDRYSALMTGKVDVVGVFTTEGQLTADDAPVVLSDPKGIFGHQNITPVVSRDVLREQGPAFARTLDAVTVELTDEALQAMNAAVDLRGERPADVARRFLRERKLLR